MSEARTELKRAAPEARITRCLLELEVSGSSSQPTTAFMSFFQSRWISLCTPNLFDVGSGWLVSAPFTVQLAA
eukprot:353284-Chlamydomonas_euryale.AAC.12